MSARASQVVVESIDTIAATARASQVVVESVNLAASNARASQVVIEVLARLADTIRIEPTYVLQLPCYPLRTLGIRRRSKV